MNVQQHAREGLTRAYNVRLGVADLVRGLPAA